MLHFFQFCHRSDKRCTLFSFSSKWFGNLKKDIIDKRLVNSVKYHYLSLRLVCSLFTCKRFENKFKNKHKMQIKLSNVETCTTDLASYSLTQWQFWQLTLKLLSGARVQDKNKRYYCWFLFFLFLFNYVIQGKSITWLANSALNCTWKPISHSSLPDSCDIGFRVQFNAEFPRQVMNFPIILFYPQWNYFFPQSRCFGNSFVAQDSVHYGKKRSRVVLSGIVGPDTFPPFPPQ